MSVDPSQPASSGAPDHAARASMMARVQEQLTTSRRGSEDRRCPLCGEPVRGGQACITLHGTTVHERCRSASR